MMSHTFQAYYFIATPIILTGCIGVAWYCRMCCQEGPTWQLGMNSGNLDLSWNDSVLSHLDIMTLIRAV